MKKITKELQKTEQNNASREVLSCAGACRYECTYGGPGPRSIAYSILA